MFCLTLTYDNELLDQSTESYRLAQQNICLTLKNVSINEPWQHPQHAYTPSAKVKRVGELR